MKVREIYRWIDISLHFKTWRLTDFSFKLIVILHLSLSYLSLVRAKAQALFLMKE